MKQIIYPNKRLYVSNIFNVTKPTLFEHFRDFGYIEEVIIMKNNNG